MREIRTKKGRKRKRRRRRRGNFTHKKSHNSAHLEGRAAYSALHFTRSEESDTTPTRSRTAINVGDICPRVSVLKFQDESTTGTGRGLHPSAPRALPSPKSAQALPTGGHPPPIFHVWGFLCARAPSSSKGLYLSILKPQNKCVAETRKNVRSKLEIRSVAGSSKLVTRIPIYRSKKAILLSCIEIK